MKSLFFRDPLTPKVTKVTVNGGVI